MSTSKHSSHHMSGGGTSSTRTLKSRFTSSTATSAGGAGEGKADPTALQNLALSTQRELPESVRSNSGQLCAPVDTKAAELPTKMNANPEIEETSSSVEVVSQVDTGTETILDDDESLVQCYSDTDGFEISDTAAMLTPDWVAARVRLYGQRPHPDQVEAFRQSIYQICATQDEVDMTALERELTKVYSNTFRAPRFENVVDLVTVWTQCQIFNEPQPELRDHLFAEVKVLLESGGEKDLFLYERLWSFSFEDAGVALPFFLRRHQPSRSSTDAALSTREIPSLIKEMVRRKYDMAAPIADDNFACHYMSHSTLEEAFNLTDASDDDDEEVALTTRSFLFLDRDEPQVARCTHDFLCQRIEAKEINVKDIVAIPILFAPVKRRPTDTDSTDSREPEAPALGHCATLYYRPWDRDPVMFFHNSDGSGGYSHVFQILHEKLHNVGITLVCRRSTLDVFQDRYVSEKNSCAVCLVNVFANLMFWETTSRETGVWFFPPELASVGLSKGEFGDHMDILLWLATLHFDEKISDAEFHEQVDAFLKDSIQGADALRNDRARENLLAGLATRLGSTFPQDDSQWIGMGAVSPPKSGADRHPTCVICNIEVPSALWLVHQQNHGPDEVRRWHKIQAQLVQNLDARRNNIPVQDNGSCQRCGLTVPGLMKESHKIACKQIKYHRFVLKKIGIVETTPGAPRPTSPNSIEGVATPTSPGPPQVTAGADYPSHESEDALKAAKERYQQEIEDSSVCVFEGPPPASKRGSRVASLQLPRPMSVVSHDGPELSSVVTEPDASRSSTVSSKAPSTVKAPRVRSFRLSIEDLPPTPREDPSALVPVAGGGNVPVTEEGQRPTSTELRHLPNEDGDEEGFSGRIQSYLDTLPSFPSTVSSRFSTQSKCEKHVDPRSQLTREELEKQTIQHQKDQKKRQKAKAEEEKKAVQARMQQGDMLRLRALEGRRR